MNMKWLGVASGALLLLAIPTGWPYNLYILLRWAICISASVVAYGFYKSSLQGWALVFVAIGLLFNPLIPVYLAKSSWVLIDFISAIVFFLSAYSVKTKR